MAAISNQPFPPARNPSKRKSLAPSLANRTVRLEAPDELTGEWEGPVYATLSRDSKLLQPTDTGPFVAEDDGVRRPAWQATLTILRHGQRREDLSPALQEHVDVPYWIPYWRLTQPDRDLTDELLERPLLSVFRFVRFRVYYVASPDADTKFVRHTSGVPILGQVLSYSRAAKMSLVDNIDLLLEPGSGFVCRVAIREYLNRPRQVVALPLEDVRTSHVSALEFILGYCPRRQTSEDPSEFQRAWSTLSLAGASDTATLRSRLAAAFTTPGAGSGPMVDLGEQAVAYVSPRGGKTAVVPIAYVQQITTPPTYDEDRDDEPEPALPLLVREDAILTPADLFRVPGTVSTPGVAATGPTPAPADRHAERTPAAASNLATTTVEPPNSTATMLSALIEQQRIAAASTAALVRQVAALTTLVSDRRQASVSDHDIPPVDSGRHANRTIHGAFDAGDADLPRSPRGYVLARGRSVTSPRPGRSSPAPAGPNRPPPESPRVRSPTPPRRSSSRPRDRRSRSRSAGRRVRRHFRSPSRSRGRLADSFQRSRSRSRGRSPQGHRPTGANVFRPSENEAIVHDIVRVGPRHLNPDTGNDEFPRFTNMSAHDRACFMLQHECFRGQYHVTKVAIKMLYAVNFGSRPFDHFLSSEDPDSFYQDRSIVHDDAQWSGPEPSPRFQIRQADQLHHVLHVIQEAAAEWYPSDLAVVFRSVHGDAVHSVQHRSPPQVVHARCNLYQAVFGELFQDILHGIASRDLDRRACRMLSSDSPAYQRYVGRVLNDVVLQAVFPHSGPAPRHRDGRFDLPARNRDRQAARSRRPPNTGQRPTRTVIPPVIRDLIPLVNGTQVCLRYQAATGCTFPRCPHVHQLHSLPSDVLRWVTDNHGALKGGHPQHP